MITGGPVTDVDLIVDFRIVSVLATRLLQGM